MVPVLAASVVGVVKGSPVSGPVGLVLLAVALPTCVLSILSGRRPVLVLTEDHIKIRGTPPIRYEEIASLEVRLLAGKEVLCLALRDPNCIPAAWTWWKRYGIRNLLDVSVGLAGLEVEPKQIVSHVYLRVQAGGTADCAADPSVWAEGPLLDGPAQSAGKGHHDT